MKIYLIGNNGLLGSHFTKALSKNGHEVFTSELRTSEDHCLFINKNEIEAVINCASVGSIEQVKHDPMKSHEVNVNLPVALSQLDVSLIQFSTDYVCDPVLSLYALQKYYMEQMIRKKSATIIRISSLYDSKRGIISKMMDEEKTHWNLNDIAPTPAQFIAEYVSSNLYWIILKDSINLWPEHVPAFTVAQEVRGKMKTNVGKYDIQRPERVALKSHAKFDWIELMKKYS